MKCWDLILDDVALLEFFSPNEEQPWEERANEIHDFKQALKHHRIVFSDSLMDIIKANHGITAKDFVQSKIRSMNVASHLTKIEDTNSCQYISDWIEMATKDDLIEEWFIVYKDLQNISPLKAKVSSDRLYSEEDTIRQCIENKIRRNSSDCAIRVINSSSCTLYAEWFNELFENETTITIFDQFFTTTDSLKSVELYLSEALRGKRLFIYTDLNEWEKFYQRKEDIRRWNCIAKEKQISITIYASRSRKKTDEEHDRHLFLSSNIHVTIGRSFDFLDACSGKAHGTTVTIKKDTQTTFRSILSEYETNNISAYQRVISLPKQ